MGAKPSAGSPVGTRKRLGEPKDGRLRWADYAAEKLASGNRTKPQLSLSFKAKYKITQCCGRPGKMAKNHFFPERASQKYS